MMKKLITILLLSLALAGCSSHSKPIAKQSSSPVHIGYGLPVTNSPLVTSKDIEPTSQDITLSDGKPIVNQSHWAIKLGVILGIVGLVYLIAAIKFPKIETKTEKKIVDEVETVSKEVYDKLKKDIQELNLYIAKYPVAPISGSLS